MHINRGTDYQPVIPSFVTEDGGPVATRLSNSRPPTPEPGDSVGTSPDPGLEKKKKASSNLGETMDQQATQFVMYDQLLVELHREDQRASQNFLRMSPDMYEELVQRVGPRITKQV